MEKDMTPLETMIQLTKIALGAFALYVFVVWGQQVLELLTDIASK